MPHRRSCTSTALLAIITGTIPLAGCSERGADSRKVAEAARDLGLVGSSGLSPESGEFAVVSGKIQNISVSSETAQAVASGLLAQSLQGEAAEAMGRASLAERALLSELDEVLVLGRRFETLTTTAESLAAFDPTPDLERIASETARLRAETESTRDERGALVARLETLESNAAVLRGQSAQKRDRAAEMKLASASLSATEAAAQAGAIRSLTREADGLDMRVRMLTGEAETLRPRLAELDAELGQFAEQIELAAEAADDLRAMSADRRAQAETASSEAAGIAEAIRAAVNAIDSQRSSDAIPAGEEATDALERSSRESDQAARRVRATGSLSGVAAQRRLGEILHMRAHGHERYASMLERLAAITGLPNASAYAQAAAAERGEALELRDQAALAYEQAASKLGSSGSRGAGAERAERTAERLNELAALLRAEGGTPAPDAPMP